jgi:hypothetical protein
MGVALDLFFDFSAQSAARCTAKFKGCFLHPDAKKQMKLRGRNESDRLCGEHHRSGLIDSEGDTARRRLQSHPG